MNKRLILSLACFLSTTLVFAQEAIKARPSPTAIVTMTFEDTYMKITYCQPHKNGRQIFGDLVPFGEVWRTGANEATEITITQAILLGGKSLNPGTYSIFTVPDKEKWTIIINSGLGQWGSYTYNKDLDILRFDVPVESTNGKVWEPFTISFEQKNDKADLVFVWDETRIKIPVEFSHAEN